MAFTPGELTNIANAALDWYYTPDNLTPLERSRQRLKIARRALKDAQAELEAALEYKTEVRRMSYAERHKRWNEPKTQFSTLFTPADERPVVKPLLLDIADLLPKKEDASGS
jgi:hypothetical protein